MTSIIIIDSNTTNNFIRKAIKAMCGLKIVHSQLSIENGNVGTAYYSLFSHEQLLFWKENLGNSLLNQCKVVHLLPHCLLIIFILSK